MNNILLEILIFSGSAVIAVPLFKKIKLGAILAYLFAGLVIGPSIFEFIKDPHLILNVSELGVVFLLFIIGLELAPAKLWKMRYTIFGLGLLQVCLTGILFTFIGVTLGIGFATAYIAGFGLALSSTAFTMQILEENRQLNTTHGQGSFSILMFQDLAVVPLIASFALFSNAESGNHGSLIFFKAIAAITILIFVGRNVIRYVLRLVADSHTQEVFIAMSLLIVIGTAILMESVGLSMGMGAFLAGVLLANSEYRHELETHLLPFKGLLLGLFFMAVGMSLDLSILKEKPHVIIFLVFAFMTLKVGIIYFLSRLFKYPLESARNMAFTLPQGGEFAFVLFSTALSQKLMDSQLASILNASVTISMALTPLIFSINQKWFRRYSEMSEQPYDNISSEDPDVIIAGFGRFGQIVARFLKTEHVRYTILEHSAAQVDAARKFGNKIYYGDASRREILESAGAKKAKIFVLAIDDVDKSVATAKMVREHFPQLEIIARVRNRQHALDMFELGIKNVHRETYLTSLEVAKEVMLSRGQTREVINKRLAQFRQHDEKIMRQQLAYRHDEKKFISFTNQANDELQRILAADKEN